MKTPVLTGWGFFMPCTWVEPRTLANRETNQHTRADLTRACARATRHKTSTAHDRVAHQHKAQLPWGRVHPTGGAQQGAAEPNAYGLPPQYKEGDKNGNHA